MQHITFKYAGFWRRVAAFVIDVAILSPLFVLIVVMGISVIVVMGISVIVVMGISVENFLATQFNFSSDRINQLITMVLCFIQSLYIIIFTTSGWQGTIGKKLLRIYVVNHEGEKPSFWQVIGRSTIGYYIIGMIPFAYVMAGFTRKKTTMYDLAFQTYVICGKPNNPIPYA